MVAGGALAARERTVRQLRAERDQALAERDDALVQRDRTRSELDEANSVTERLRDEITSLDERAHTAETALAASSQELTEIRAELKVALGTITTRDQQAKVHRRTHRALEDERGELRAEFNRSNRRISTATALLSLGSAAGVDAAAHVLRGGAASAQRSLGDALDRPPPEREAQLRTLTQTEAHFGRWSSAYASSVRTNRPEPDVAGVLLVNDTRTQNNIGCRTTTTQLIRIIEAAGHRVRATVTLAELDLVAAELWHRAGCGATEDNLDAMVGVLSHDPGFELLRGLISGASAVVVNGEGSIYDRQSKGLVTLAIASMCAERLDRPVALVNHSADLHDPVMAAWADRTFPASIANVFREPISLERLAAPLRTPRVTWAPDAAFCLTPQPTTDAEPPRETALGEDSVLDTRMPDRFVAISGSSSLYRRDRASGDPLRSVGQLCERLRSLGHDVVLVESDKRDRQLLRPLAIEMSLPYVSAANPTATFQRALQRADCLISGRWHTSIIGAVEGCPPVLADANFFKTEALHQMLDLPWPMFEYRSLDDQMDEVLDTVATIARDRATLGDTVARRAQQLAEHSRSELAATLESLPSPAAP